MAKYPTGVENHGGNLRLWFIYKGERVRESLGVPDTPKNRKIAGELRTSICFAIKMGTFDYAEQFPSSPNLTRFVTTKREITIGDLADKWLSIKETEIAGSTLDRYRSKIKNSLPFIGSNRLVSSITQEDILNLRKELLTGFQTPGYMHKVIRKGRSVPTVNSYISGLTSLFRFALANNYIASDPTANITPLRKGKPEPDPLTREEFVRMIDAFRERQIRNIWSLAVYTGMRHGEICALAWEDIDLKAGTLSVRRNLAKVGEFTLPKTAAGERTINLIRPAIEILRDQSELTRLSKQHDIPVTQREYGRKTTHKCTFVFIPSVSATNGRSGDHYSVGSISQSWDTALKRAGLKHRKAYQSRHTYACWSLSAGANPNFIASQMGHTNAQMVYQVYGAWMEETNSEQVAMLNQKLSDFAPPLPHSKVSNS